MDQSLKDAMRKALTQLIEKLDEGDLIGIGIVAIDSGYNVETSAVSEADANYEMIAGVRLLDSEMIKAMHDNREQAQLAAMFGISNKEN